MSMRSKNPVNTSAGINALSLGGAAFMRGKANSNHQGNGELAGQMAKDASTANGLDITKVYAGLILGMGFFVGLFLSSVHIRDWEHAPYFLEVTLGNWFIGLILMMVAGITSIGFLVGMFVTLPQLMGVKMKARVYDINSSAAKNAGRYQSNPVMGLITTAIGGALFFTTVYPFFLLQNAFEVLRVVKSVLAASPVAFRGDSGRYYDRMRKAYTQMVAAGATKTEAEDMLREASDGMFTPRNAKISMTDWNNGGRDRILATMIRRHGPIDMYVGTVTGRGTAVNAKKDDLSNYGKDRDGVSRKYSAL